MSYGRSGDEDDDVRLGRLRERLEYEVSARTGVDFSILADRADAAWADHWRHRVEETVDADTMLLVIVTPDLFGSAACREEIARFREREKKLGRDDLIAAVYYASAPAMDSRIPRRGDEMARLLRSRRYADWRNLRFEPMTSPAAGDAIGQLANRMTDVFLADPVAVPAHLVDASGRGGLTSVSAAIKAARPGDRILVRPGTYTDALVIDKPLEIIGDGRAEDIVIQVRDNHAVTLRASSGRIANLTLRQDGGHKTWWNGVFVVQGELDIDDCDISCPALSGVAVAEGAAAHVRRSTIHHAKSMGVACGGKAAVRNNQIHDNGHCGVVADAGSGTVEDNDIVGNKMWGVIVRDGADCALRRNRVNRNGNEAVLVHDGASAMVEDNDLTGNARGAWSIAKDCAPNVTRARNKE